MTFRDKLREIKMVVFDVDGVMTDGTIVIDDNGVESKSFHARDGIGIKMIIDKGIVCSIITGRESNIVSKRAAELGIQEIHQGIKNKLEVYDSILKKYGFHDQDVLCVGDDIPERAIFERAAIGICVNDAHESLKEGADMVTRSKGGHGAVREVTDMIMDARGWDLFVPGNR